MSGSSMRDVPGNSGFFYSVYTTMATMEKGFDAKMARQWMEDWSAAPIYASCIYLSVIFTIQKYMAHRKTGWNLQHPMAIWNGSLAAFSIVGTLRSAPVMIRYVLEYGFMSSVCSTKFLVSNSISAFWSWLFVMSKFVELGDTLFIVLRKRKLQFLHWFHHVTVLPLAYYSYLEFAGTAQWYGLLNYGIHSVMYCYYTLQSLRIKIPRWVAPVITVFQILQMITGVWVTLYAYSAKSRGVPCHVTYESLMSAAFVYVCYLFLFLKFFYKTYVSRKQLKLE